MLFPAELEKSYAFGERAQWYMIWESHSWDDDPARHGIYVNKRKDSSQYAAFIDRMGTTHQYYDDFEIWSDFTPGY